MTVWLGKILRRGGLARNHYSPRSIHLASSDAEIQDSLHGGNPCLTGDDRLIQELKLTLCTKITDIFLSIRVIGENVRTGTVKLTERTYSSASVGPCVFLGAALWRPLRGDGGVGQKYQHRDGFIRRNLIWSRP